MKVWKDKKGEKITAKEFGQRFKEGLNSLTPIQKLKNEVRSTFVMFIGYIVGLVSLIIYRKAFAVQWFTIALIIIFLGASWSNGIKWFAMRQQLKLMKNMDMESLDFKKIFGAMKEEKEEVEEVVEEEWKPEELKEEVKEEPVDVVEEKYVEEPKEEIIEEKEEEEGGKI